MANREKGEIDVDLGGKTYTLVMRHDAMCDVEAVMSTPQKEVTFQEVVMKSVRGSARHSKALLWGMLRTHHPDVKFEHVGRLIDAAGGMAVIDQAVTAAFKAGSPDPDEAKKAGVATERPREAQATAQDGQSSTPMHGASA